MTTIAYRDGVMAADTALTVDGVYQGEIVKTVLLNAHVIGVAGLAAHQVAFCQFLDGQELTLEKDQFFNAIVVSPEGNLAVYDQHLIPVQLNVPFHAIGSGREIAIGAMAAGATAEEAVRIACCYDAYSAEPVTIELIGAIASEEAA